MSEDPSYKKMRLTALRIHEEILNGIREREEELRDFVKTIMERVSNELIDEQQEIPPITPQPLPKALTDAVAKTERYFTGEEPIPTQVEPSRDELVAKIEAIKGVLAEYDDNDEIYPGDVDTYMWRIRTLVNYDD